MLIDDIYNIYAKTGSGTGKSWYVGYFEYNNQNVYFATFIQGENSSGGIAKDISISIIQDWDKIGG